MALVVLLRGVNVGGHRTFRPAQLVKTLHHLDAVNIGATGTFVVRRPGSRTRLREDIAKHVPFACEMTICAGNEISALLSHPALATTPSQSGVVRFVSVLARLPRTAPQLPIVMPSRGPWLLKLLAREGRFVFGVYKRHMKVIGYLGKLDELFGVPVTTRSWGTITAIAKALNATA